METLQKPTALASSAANTQLRPRIASEALLHGNKTLEIEHAGQRYLLHVTSQNKLILTK